MRRESGIGSRESVGMPTLSIISTMSGPSHSPRRSRAAFTLVEMLVVVLIMALLIGLLVRTLGGAGRQSDKAVTLARIERVKAALEEFYAEYGQYPPVPFYKPSPPLPDTGEDTYYDESGNKQTYDRIQPVYMEFPVKYTMDDEFSGVNYLDTWPKASDATDSSATRLFTLGLVSFLVKRYDTVTNESFWFRTNLRAFNDTAQWDHFTETTEIKDSPRDINAIARWEPFLEGVLDDDNKGMDSLPRGPNPNSTAGTTHVNSAKTIKDAWGQHLRYESLPPHQSYKLYSIGPNKRDEQGRGDDIGVTMNH